MCARAHTPTLGEAAIWSAVYVGIAVLFGVGVWLLGGATLGSEYFAGYITEKALSVDNLFVFLIIMASFKVPRADQQKALLFGIVFSLFARTAFIFLGAALVNSYRLRVLPLRTDPARHRRPLLNPGLRRADPANNIIVRLAKRFLRTSETYDGDRLFTTDHGRRVMTPMLLVMVAIGGTDVLFALDSIPAIFGLTQSVFIVFTATAFSLLGLRQLYFLIDGLLDRLIYLSYGLAAILGFIGVKLILHALAREQPPVRQRRPAPPRPRDQYQPVVERDRRRVGRHRHRVAHRRPGPRRASRAPCRRIPRQGVEVRPRRPRLNTQPDGDGRPSTEVRTSSHHDPAQQTTSMPSS